MTAEPNQERSVIILTLILLSSLRLLLQGSFDMLETLSKTIHPSPEERSAPSASHPGELSKTKRT